MDIWLVLYGINYCPQLFVLRVIIWYMFLLKRVQWPSTSIAYDYFNQILIAFIVIIHDCIDTHYVLII